MNLTDVDDKTIRGCRAAGCRSRNSPRNSRRRSSRTSRRCGSSARDTFPPRPKQRISAAMIEMIATLMARELAYQAEDKSVYFRLTNFPDYGKLAHFNLDELRPTGRVKSDEYEKETSAISRFGKRGTRTTAT